jgi:hypothetical protein
MIAGIVHHQNDPSSRVALHQQFFQKADEGRAVFPLSTGPGDRILAPVVGTKDMPVLFAARPGRWNTLLLPNLHPTSPQGRIQAQGRFVHKEEPEIVSEDLFFNSSSASAARTLAVLSCKWPRSCFGRRYRYLSACGLANGPKSRWQSHIQVQPVLWQLLLPGCDCTPHPP